MIHFLLFNLLLYSSEDETIELYQEPSVTVPVNHSSLFNAMIYPFMRMVIYGSIWYQGEKKYYLGFSHK